MSLTTNGEQGVAKSRSCAALTASSTAGVAARTIALQMLEERGRGAVSSVSLVWMRPWNVCFKRCCFRIQALPTRSSSPIDR